MELEEIRALRRALHQCPEPSGEEVRTKALLMDFLRARTGLELHPCGEGFYAARREPEGTRPPVALRADYDALALPDGGAAHLCGHDGHAAALCGAALSLEGETLGRDVFFLFQPAEETGAGASGCLELLDRERVAEIYGAHNLPGYPLGQVLTRPGTFACASRGVTLALEGRPAHAAYPEDGLSPAEAVGRLLCALPELARADRYGGAGLWHRRRPGGGMAHPAGGGGRGSGAAPWGYPGAGGVAGGGVRPGLPSRGAGRVPRHRKRPGVRPAGAGAVRRRASARPHAVERGLWALPAPLSGGLLRHRGGGGVPGPPHPGLPVPRRAAGAHSRGLPPDPAGVRVGLLL